jgi:hypothetical protein
MQKSAVSRKNRRPQAAKLRTDDRQKSGQWSVVVSKDAADAPKLKTDD